MIICTKSNCVDCIIKCVIVNSYFLSPLVGNPLAKLNLPKGHRKHDNDKKECISNYLGSIEIGLPAANREFM